MGNYELVFKLTDIHVRYKDKSNLYSDLLQVLDKEIPLIFDIRYKFKILSDNLKRNLIENTVEYKIIISADDVNSVEKAVEEFSYILNKYCNNLFINYYML